MKELLQKLLVSEALSFEESREMILWIMSEDAVSVQAAALLALLQAKGVTVEEMAGAALAMRERASGIKAPENAIDTCSTGGNGISTFNISTCAAIIAAGAGAVVAKHGNRSNTRKSGSAEALEALGVNINLELDEVEKCLQDLDICFCYAINHHPAMRFAGPIRKDLGVPTVFNLLGPLTNPAGAKSQLIGVPNVELTSKIAQVLKRLGSERVLVVHGHDGLCELTVTSPTHVAELREGIIKEYNFLYLAWSEQRESQPIPNNEKLVKPVYPYWTLAYIVTPEAAKILINSEIERNIIPVDEYLPIMMNKLNPAGYIDDVFHSQGRDVVGTDCDPKDRYQSFIDFNVHPITIGTDESKCNHLMCSGEYNNIQFNNLGKGIIWKGGDMENSQGGGQKLNILKKYISTLPDDDVVLFCDAYDVFLNS